jgi:hypothetical protein
MITYEQCGKCLHQYSLGFIYWDRLEGTKWCRTCADEEITIRKEIKRRMGAENDGVKCKISKM